MELRDYLRVLRTHWIGVLAITAAAVVAAGLYTATQPKVYSANANGFVTAGTAADPALASVTDSLARARAASYVDIAKSRAVAELVIDDLDLDSSPSDLIGDIAVNQPLNTVLIKITAEAASPDEAQNLANAWVRALAKQVKAIEDPDDSGQPGVIGIQPIESAARPGSPISPRPLVNLLVGAVMGILLAVGYAVVRSRLDRRLRDPAAVEKQFGVSIIGRVPVAAGTDMDRASLTLADAHERERWGASEAFRKLRTNLTYMRVDDPPRVIVVTSPRPGDGKSTVAANLATAIGLSGQEVTLIDGDLRRPTVAESLGLVEGAGLTDVLIGAVEIGDVLQKHPSVDSMSVLAAGSIPPNPSELLASKAMQNVLEQLSTGSIVVVDAPPILAVTDSVVLTRHSDGAIIVINYATTLDLELRDALAQLETVRGTVLGVVFNRVPRKSSAYVGYYADYYANTTTSRTPRVSPGRRRANS